MIYSIVLLFFNLILGSVSAEANIIDTSSRVFFPKEDGELIETYRKFPINWWNFITVNFDEESNEDEIDSKLIRLCDRIKRSDEIEFAICGNEFASYLPVLESWVKDFPLREPNLGIRNIKKEFGKAKAKMSFLMGQESRDIIHLLRKDPFESYLEYLSYLESPFEINIEKRAGIYFDSDSNYALVPVQFKQDPANYEGTFRLVSDLSDLGEVYVVGAHGSTLENRLQIDQDIWKVSFLGLLLLGFLFLFLILTKKPQILMMIPILVAGVFMSAAITIVWFGQIHGLTLSFGVGLVGLAFDYAFHILFSRESLSTWKANFAGFLTTFIVLFALGLSDIPLVQQLSFFSALGLTISFALLFAVFKWRPGLVQVSQNNSIPTGLAPRFTERLLGLQCVGPAKYLGLVFSLSGLVVFLFIKPDFSLRQFDYKSDSLLKAENWVRESLSVSAPVFRLHDLGDRNTVAHLEKEREWSEGKGIHFSSPVFFWSPIGEQDINLKSWSESCTSFASEFRNEELFAPFVESKSCDKLPGSFEFEELRTKSYAAALFSEKYVLSQWQPKSLEETNMVLSRFTDAKSLYTMVSSFSRILKREMMLFVPLSFGLVLIALLIFFKSVKLTLISLVPFLSALSFFGIVGSFGHWEVSFMSLVGLIMVFGLSIDYGIFATAALEKPQQARRDVTKSLLLSATTTIFGFLPLLLAQHTVLLHLGQSLVFGTVGTLLGALFLVPIFSKKIEVV